MQKHRRLRLWGSQSGFTLIELLGVMVIVLLLSLVAVNVFIGITDRARLSASAGKLTEVEKALERYQVDKGYYPRTLKQLVVDGYIREPQHAGEDPLYEAFVSPWFDIEDGKHFYYDVPEDTYPKQFLLVDPSPQACKQEATFCDTYRFDDEPQGFNTSLITELDGGWRSSGNLN